jgi:hypothetical protein
MPSAGGGVQDYMEDFFDVLDQTQGCLREWPADAP